MKVILLYVQFLTNTGTAKAIVAGLFGGLVALRLESQSKKLTVWQAGTTLVFGVIAAYYIGLATCAHWNLDGPQCALACFLPALGALKIFEALLKLLDAIIKDPWKLVNIILNRNASNNQDSEHRSGGEASGGRGNEADDTDNGTMDNQ